MNKGDLILNVAEKAGISKDAAQCAVNCVFDSIRDSLINGDSARFAGFGTFVLRNRDARTARDPRTGAAIEIPAHKVVKFSAASKLKDSVNQ